MKGKAKPLLAALCLISILYCLLSAVRFLSDFIRYRDLFDSFPPEYFANYRIPGLIVDYVFLTLPAIIFSFGELFLYQKLEKIGFNNRLFLTLTVLSMVSSVTLLIVLFILNPSIQRFLIGRVSLGDMYGGVIVFGIPIVLFYSLIYGLVRVGVLKLMINRGGFSKLTLINLLTKTRSIEAIN